MANASSIRHTETRFGTLSQVHVDATGPRPRMTFSLAAGPEHLHFEQAFSTSNPLVMKRALEIWDEAQKSKTDAKVIIRVQPSEDGSTLIVISIGKLIADRARSRMFIKTLPGRAESQAPMTTQDEIDAIADGVQWRKSPIPKISHAQRLR